LLGGVLLASKRDYRNTISAEPSSEMHALYSLPGRRPAHESGRRCDHSVVSTSRRRSRRIFHLSGCRMRGCTSQKPFMVALQSVPASTRNFPHFFRDLPQGTSVVHSFRTDVPRFFIDGQFGMRESAFTAGVDVTLPVIAQGMVLQQLTRG
jgi:hypothetical protein